MERTVQLVLGLALLVVIVQSGAAETHADAAAKNSEVDEYYGDAAAYDDSEDLPSEDDDDRRRHRITRRCSSHGSYVRWVIYGRYKYRMTPARSWAGARKICKKWGGDLATYGMRNLGRRSKIIKMLKAKKHKYWIGLNDLKQKGCFKWVDGKGGCCASKKTALWARGEPNNHKKTNERCVEVWGSRGWRSNDLPCRYKRVGICEIRG